MVYTPAETGAFMNRRSNAQCVVVFDSNTTTLYWKLPQVERYQQMVQLHRIKYSGI